MGTRLYDIDALRTIEARAGAGTDLMERAGRAAWRTLLDRWPYARRIAVVCGPGNNGGDGDVLAWHAHASGLDVVTVRMDVHSPRSHAAREMHARLRGAGVPILRDVAVIPDCDVVVDALLGIGASRAPDAPMAALIRAINDAHLPVLAIDVPSGVDPATGFAFDPAVRAAHTIEFIAPKAGLRTGVARAYVGDLSMATLDIESAVFDSISPGAYALDADDLGRRFKPRALDSYKGTHGRVLCIGGDVGHGGAILLAAEAALRSGAGLVDIETRGRHVAPALARIPEAMAHASHDANALRSRIEQATACVLGPGLGQGAWGALRFDASLAHATQLILDADALNMLPERRAALPPGTILTPHPGEAARLLSCDTRDVQRDRFGAAQRIAEMYGAIVVLKGAGTLIAAPGEARHDQVMHLIDAGNPGMAVGGMGDVLAGVIGASRAQGFGAFEAACVGALLHAVAGDAAAREGERGLLPSDLMPELRRLANPVSP